MNAFYLLLKAVIFFFAFLCNASLALCRQKLVTLKQRLDAPANTYVDCDVVIIGAGMSGISAGRYLADNLKTSHVVVLEGRSRSGGRLHSIKTKYGGQRIDEGAMWIHNGVKGNPLFDLATSLNLSLSSPENYLSGSVYTVDNKPVPIGSENKVYEPWIMDVTSRIDDMRNNPATNVSSRDVPILKIYQDFITKNNLTTEQIQATNLLAHTSFSVLLNGNLTQLSTLRYGDAKTLPAIDVLFRDGFDSLTDALKSTPTPLNITYNTTVTSVTYDEDGVVVVAACRGDDDDDYTGSSPRSITYFAKYVIHTASLGCLKHGDVVFNPPLPNVKLQAIKEMGMGVLDKAIAVWDRPFWDSTDFISRHMPDLSGKWAIFLNQNRTLGIPSLVALNVADTAREIEALDENEIRREVMTVLHSMYDDRNTNFTVPEPSEFYVTRWASDPFARGSYSYFAVGNEKNITATLGEPVDRLHFAGEATSSHPATVLGAYESGLREGQRIMQRLQEECDSFEVSEASNRSDP